MEDDYSPGEVRRSLQRIETKLVQMEDDVRDRYNDLSNKVQAALGPLSEVRYEVKAAKKDIDELFASLRGVRRQLDRVNVRVATIAGGITGAVLLIKFLAWH